MPFPIFAIGPSLTIAGWIRERHQSRRKVRLTVHCANEVVGVDPATRQPILGRENYYITITNASRDRDIVVTHVWLDTTPRVGVVDVALPVPAALQRAVGDGSPGGRSCRPEGQGSVACALPTRARRQDREVSPA
jgi:hypothetical protein